jgi:hypothetical protein
MFKYLLFERYPSQPINDEYIEWAIKIDFIPNELVERILVGFFKENEIQLYDHEKVESFLAKEYNDRNSWDWQPLRESDNIDIDNYYMLGGTIVHGQFPYLIPVKYAEAISKLENKTSEVCGRFTESRLRRDKIYTPDGQKRKLAIESFKYIILVSRSIGSFIHFIALYNERLSKPIIFGAWDRLGRDSLSDKMLEKKIEDSKTNKDKIMSARRLIENQDNLKW